MHTGRDADVHGPLGDVSKRGGTRAEDGAIPHVDTRSDECVRPDPGVGSDRDRNTPQRHLQICHVVIACAEVDALADHGPRSDCDLAEVVNLNSVAESHAVAERQMPGDLDGRRTPDQAAATDPRPEESEQKHTPPVRATRWKPEQRPMDDVPAEPDSLVRAPELAHGGTATGRKPHCSSGVCVMFLSVMHRRATVHASPIETTAQGLLRSIPGSSAKADGPVLWVDSLASDPDVEHASERAVLRRARERNAVAAGLDDSTERIIGYLNEREIPINVLFFQVFDHGMDKLISRTWMIDPEETQSNAATVPTKRGDRGPWNGEFFGSFGGDCTWDEARKFGFISAGGGIWYTQTLKLLKPGDRIWVRIPRKG
jgi:hypothetical protein